MLNEIELQAVKTLLDEGMKVPVTAPSLFGKKKQKHLIVRQPVLGTLYRITKVRLASGLKAKTTYDADYLFLNHGPAMARIVAYAVLNGFWSGLLFSWLLSKWLTWKLSPIYLKAVVDAIEILTAKEAFTNTITSVDNMIMTTPNMSQPPQGS